jgi:hypothetical protein
MFVAPDPCIVTLLGVAAVPHTQTTSLLASRAGLRARVRPVIFVLACEPLYVTTILPPVETAMALTYLPTEAPDTAIVPAPPALLEVVGNEPFCA